MNTLYITTEGAYVRLDHDTLRVDVEGQTKLQVPLLHLGAIVCFGNVLMSPAAIHRCAEEGRNLTLLDRNGRFKARVEGPISGNVLLRKAQHLAHQAPGMVLEIARNIVGGKLHNARYVLGRGSRDAQDQMDRERLDEALKAIAGLLPGVAAATDTEQLRGFEGMGGRHYFEVFDRMLKVDRDSFQMSGRNRRPPLDPVNALLSFLYTLLASDCASACQGVGLDPQVGFFHELRPGRPALALDLMEELRPLLADRVALTLINLRQVKSADFESRPGGGVYLTDAGRKAVLVAYQKRKQEEVAHPLLMEKLPWGLIPHVQARLLARHLRGDLEHYVPFMMR